MNSARKSTAACYVVGNGSLAYECIKKLNSHASYQLSGVVTSDKKIKKWCEKQNLSKFDSVVDLLSSDIQEFQYLFSIANDQLLPASLLGMAKIAAINYHDSLLPAYAGVHATAWAILNDEKQHGVTWHIMEEKVDTGAILKQTKVKVAPNDTTQLLNVKCFSVSVDLFVELIDDLANDNITPVRQDLSQRTYFPYAKKPATMGYVDFSESSDSIYRTWRALTFGEANNQLASCKLLTSFGSYIIEGMHVLKSAKKQRPGTIVDLNPNSLRVATSTDDIVISSIKTIRGKKYTISHFAAESELNPGDILPAIDVNEIKNLIQSSENLFFNEKYWVNEWERVTSQPLPYFNYPEKTAKSKGEYKLKLGKNEQDWKVFVLSILVAYLHRITGQKNVVLGLVDSFFNSSNLEKGCFSEIIPFVVQISSSDSLRIINNQISGKLLEVKDKSTYLNDIFYRYTSLRHVAAENFNSFPILVEHVNKGAIPNEINVDKPCLKLRLDSKNKQITMELFQANGEDVKAKTLLKQIAAHFLAFEKLHKNNPEEALVKLDYLTQKEKNIAKRYAGSVDKKYLSKSILEIFDTQVKKYGDRDAVCYQGVLLTYAELDLQSTALMQYMFSQGVTAKERVVILHERSIDVIVAMLATLKAGCAYVPVNPDYPESRIKYIVEESRARIILSSEKFSKKIQALGVESELKVVNIQKARKNKMEATSKEVCVTHKSTPNDIAYVLYTSGSTGDPKGVEICHKGIVRLVKDQNYIDITEKDVVAQFGNYVFDASTFEIWGALLNGALLKIIHTDEKTDLEALYSQVAHSCTIFASTLTVFKDIFTTKPDFFDNLRVLQIGGESIHAKDIKSLLKRKKNNSLKLSIYNMYGPTENTTNSLFYLINNISRGVDRIPIGQPIKSTEAVVLDNDLNILPVGVPGVLFLGGDGLSKGYINDPKRTEEFFVKSPFSKGMLYKTNDIVRLRHDGNFEFLGRTDKQVKIRGVRVELEEIEMCLLECPSVAQAVVMNYSLANDKDILIAFVVLNGKRNSESLIRKYCQNKLPTEFIPSEIIIIDRVPYTDHQKVDKNELIKLRLMKSKDAALPLKDKERLLSDILKKLLNISEIRSGDNFFALGGDSILAMQFVTSVRKSGWEIKSSDIFSHPSLSAMAKRLKKLKEKELIKSGEFLGGVIPLTPIQSWFFDHYQEGTSAFNQGVLLRVKNKVNPSVLEKAFNAVIQNHDMLRASFSQKDGKWIQTIKEKVDLFKVQIEEIEALDDQERIKLIESQLYIHAKIFNLNEPPLINAIIYPGWSGDFVHIVFHHLIIDGVSWRFLLEDIFNAYNSHQNGEVPIFPLKTSSYHDWSNFLNNDQTKKEAMKARKFWLKQVSSFKLPVDHGRGENLEVYSEKIYSILDIAKTRLRYNQVRPLDMLVSSLVVTLCQWSGQKNVGFYLENHGRENFDGRFDLTSTVGWFTSLFPLSFEIKHQFEDIKLLSVLKSVREKLKSFRRHGIDYGVLKYLVVDEKLNSNKSFVESSSLCFNFLGNFDASLGVGSDDFEIVGNPVRLETEATTTRANLINITAWIKNNHLHVEWQYSKNHFNTETVEMLSSDYMDNLIKLGDQCLTSLSHTFVPADFPLAHISRSQLDYYLNKYPNLEDIAVLSPIQNGLIFHHLQLKHTHIYHSQLIWSDYRELDLNVFKLAWREMVNRHSIFRSKFVWKRLDSPLQIIDSRSKLPWQTYDCSALSESERKLRVENIILEEHKKEFDFSVSPLMRVCVVKLSDNEHVIIWTHHHILLGGWSISTVLSELYSIYSSIHENQPLNLPDPIPYTDYIKYHAAIGNSNSSKRFWKKYLKHFSSSFITKQSSNKDYLSELDYGAIENILPFNTVKDIKKIAKEQHVSLYTLMLFAWSYLVSHYSSSDDVCVGVVVSTRDYGEKYHTDMVGPMINTLPFRLSIDINASIKDSLKKVRAHISQTKRHSHTSLVDIHRWLKRSTQNPLFDTLFIFENYPLTFSDGNVSDLTIKDITHYPLALTVYPGDKIRLKLTYHKNILPDEVVQNIMSNYCVTLTNMMKDFSGDLTSVEIISPEEKNILMNVWNDTTLPYPRKSLYDLFDLKAKSQPDKIAISDRNTSITYSELSDLAEKWAAYFVQKGLKKGSVVAVYTKRNIQMVASMLGILKLGGVYVPIDESIPVDRLDFIIKDANVKFILSHRKHIHYLSRYSTCKVIDIFDEKITASTGEVGLTNTISPDEIMYTIYTSGTTGTPKGIQVKHSGVVNAISSIFNTLSVTSDDKLLSITTIAFDISVLEIFGSLLWGLELVLTDSDEVMQPELLIKIIKETKPTLIQATPSYWKLILDSGWKNAAHIKILCGGEVLTDDLAQRLMNTGASLWNVYGPSETTIWSSISQLQPGKKVVIGKPLANTKFYILDEHQRMVPIGVEGELYISGAGVAKGYLNRSELTQKHFLSNPYSKEQTVMYRTGDVVQWLPNGELQYNHRIDNQIKLHGFRIELEEIRSVILEHPNIKDCVVAKMGNSYEASYLVAFYILKKSENPVAKNEINILLSPKLPHYMIPSKFISVSNFPLNQNGKIDMSVLCSFGEIEKATHDEGALGGNPTEQIVIDLFCNTLKTKKVNLHDNFFDLGGDSITAIRLLSCIQEYFSISVTINEILSNQSPFQISQMIFQKRYLKRDTYEDIPSPIVCLQPLGSKPPLFIIHPISGMVFWFVKLAKLLGTDRPIYGIQDPGLQSHKPHFTNFETMASFYLKEIKQVYPTGPYYLCGASFGANMAVEVARQLIQKGDVVSFVGLFDGWQIYPDKVSTHEFLEHRMKLQFEQIKQKVKGIDHKNMRPVINISWHRSHLLSNHKHEWIDCPLVLFKASEVLDEFNAIDSPDNHWSQHCPELDIISVPGDHETMFYDPNVEILANKINQSMDGRINKNLFVAVEEIQEVPEAWSHGQKMKIEKNIIELFEEINESYPNEIAAVHDGTCITYDQLHDRTNQLANYLGDLGVKQGDVVGICIERGFSMLITLIGILKTGAAFTPIHLSSPTSKIMKIQSDCRVIITQKSLYRKFNADEKNVICIDRDWAYIMKKSTSYNYVPINLSDTAFVLFSSVSLVEPRGIIVTHKNISNMVHWALNEFSQEELSGVLASTSLSEDMAAFEIFSALCAGGCVHLVNNIQELADAQFAENITLINTKPSYLRDVMLNGAVPSSATVLLLSKESLARSFINDVYKSTSIEKIYNCYVQEEGGIVTCASFSREENQVPTVGRPILNASAYVLDENLKPVSVNEAGDLYIAGDILSPGYYNNDNITNRSYLRSPFDDGNENLYKTGDKVRWLSSGHLEFLGKNRKGLIIKGFLIELAEIEKLLSQYPAIDSARVNIEVNENGEQRLIIYFVPIDANVTLRYDDLTKFIKQFLFPFSYPCVFVQVDTLPKESLAY